MRRRLNAPLMVLAYRDNHQAATTVPAGRTIDILGQAEDDRFSVIRVDGEEFLVFESDLQDRESPFVRKKPTVQELTKVRRASA